jgi:hydrocephalus-inducing protein
VILDASINFPFVLEKSHFQLDVGESIDFTVTFDPSRKLNFQSETITSRIIFSFKDNPKKCFVNLKAVMLFPNLSFSVESIDFGSRLKHTEDYRQLQIKNTASVMAVYTWQLLVNDHHGREVSNIFDVSPLRSQLQPGQDEQISITFCASSNEKTEKYNGIAICHVHGGPDYPITLTGSSADIRFKITPDLIDFGHHHFAQMTTSTLTLQNLSDVSFTYSIQIPRGCTFQHIDISPSSGKLLVNGSVVFSITVRTGRPQKYKEKFFIQIGHVHDAQVDVKIKSEFPQFELALPRTEDDPLLKYQEENADINLSEAEHTLMIRLLNSSRFGRPAVRGLFDARQI